MYATLDRIDLHERVPEGDVAPAIRAETPAPTTSKTAPVTPPDQTPSLPAVLDRLNESISGRRALTTFLAWATFFVALSTLSPAPTNPDAPVPLWEAYALAGFSSALLLMLAGLMTRRRWALHASAAAAGLGLVVGLACLSTAHHAGLFPFAEMGAMVFIGGHSLRSLLAEGAGR